MKKFLVILLFIYGANLSYAKQCISKRSTETGESKYTEQHSIETNISGHKLRIFTLVVNPKSSNKNCDGLKVIESVFWGMSNYVNKNGGYTRLIKCGFRRGDATPVSQIEFC